MWKFPLRIGHLRTSALRSKGEGLEIFDFLKQMTVFESYVVVGFLFKLRTRHYNKL